MSGNENTLTHHIDPMNISNFCSPSPSSMFHELAPMHGQTTTPTLAVSAFSLTHGFSSIDVPNISSINTALPPSRSVNNQSQNQFNSLTTAPTFVMQPAATAASTTLASKPRIANHGVAPSSILSVPNAVTTSAKSHNYRSCQKRSKPKPKFIEAKFDSSPSLLPLQASATSSASTCIVEKDNISAANNTGMAVQLDEQSVPIAAMALIGPPLRIDVKSHCDVNNMMGKEATIVTDARLSKKFRVDVDGTKTSNHQPTTSNHHQSLTQTQSQTRASFQFVQNQSVEVNWRSKNEWRSAFICKVTPISGSEVNRYLYDILYADGKVESSVTAERIRASTIVTTPASNSSKQVDNNFNVRQWRVAQTVEGNFKNLGRWYSGTVQKVHPQADGTCLYDIIFHDGDSEKNVPASRIRNAHVLVSHHTFSFPNC
jgi:hypothetical protein